MTPADLDRIAAKLGIELPPQYRQQMTGRTQDLVELGYADRDLAPVYATAERVIASNLEERKRKAPTAVAYPQWWQEFFIVGTNGAGEYYALRLAGDKHVYLIGDEHGDEAERRFKSLKHFLDDLLDESRNPPQPPSSFDDSLPLISRFAFVVWDTQSTIEAYDGANPLSVKGLRHHGIKLAAIQRALRKLLAALAGCKPSAIKFADPPVELETDHSMLIHYDPPPMRDPRFDHAALRIFRGNVKVDLTLADRTLAKPPADQAPFDWSAVQEGIRGLFEVFLPPGTTMEFAPPQDDPNYLCDYLLTYTLTPAHGRS